jgi:hypothetical protein
VLQALCAYETETRPPEQGGFSEYFWRSIDFAEIGLSFQSPRVALNTFIQYLMKINGPCVRTGDKIGCTLTEEKYVHPAPCKSARGAHRILKKGYRRSM